MDVQHGGARRTGTIERRAPTPHPGVRIAADYIEPLGFDAHSYAALIGMDGDRLAAMLAGTMSLDVDAAVRLGHSLGLPAERLMRDQLRCDFAASREIEHLLVVPSPATLVDRPFPSDALQGHLARTDSAEEREMYFFVTDDVNGGRERDMARIHTIRVGDRLRIKNADGAFVWAGPVLRNLNGRFVFAFASARMWQAWFDAEARAEYVPAS